MTDEELRARVAREVTLRYGSAREAAKAGDVSNTMLSSWLRGSRPIGDKVRHGVAKAFGWPADWPENPPPMSTVETVELSSVLQELGAKVDGFQERFDEIAQQLDALAARIERPASPPPASVRRQPPGR